MGGDGELGVVGPRDRVESVEEVEVVRVAGVEGFQVEVGALEAGSEDLAGGGDDRGTGPGVLQAQAVRALGGELVPSQAWTRTPGSSLCTDSISQAALG